MATFNPNYQWRIGDKTAPVYGNNFSAESGEGTHGTNYAGAFSGVDGLTGASKTGDNAYTLYRDGKGLDRWRAEATVGPNGQANVGRWVYDPITSSTSTALQGAALGAAMFGGLGMLGQGPMAGLFGAGSGAASGAGFVGEGVGSGVGAWDAAMGGSMLDAGAAAGSAGASGGGLLNTAKDLAGKVPGKVWSSLAGGLLSTGGDTTAPGYSGPMPTITRGDWKAQVTPKYMPVQDVGKLTKWGK